MFFLFSPFHREEVIECFSDEWRGEKKTHKMNRHDLGDSRRQQRVARLNANAAYQTDRQKQHLANVQQHQDRLNVRTQEGRGLQTLNSIGQNLLPAIGGVVSSVGNAAGQIAPLFAEAVAPELIPVIEGGKALSGAVGGGGAQAAPAPATGGFAQGLNTVNQTLGAVNQGVNAAGQLGSAISNISSAGTPNQNVQNPQQVQTMQNEAGQTVSSGLQGTTPSQQGNLTNSNAGTTGLIPNHIAQGQNQDGFTDFNSGEGQADAMGFQQVPAGRPAAQSTAVPVQAPSPTVPQQQVNPQVSAITGAVATSNAALEGAQQVKQEIGRSYQQAPIDPSKLQFLKADGYNVTPEEIQRMQTMLDFLRGYS